MNDPTQTPERGRAARPVFDLRDYQRGQRRELARARKERRRRRSRSGKVGTATPSLHILAGLRVLVLVLVFVGGQIAGTTKARAAVVPPEPPSLAFVFAVGLLLGVFCTVGFAVVASPEWLPITEVTAAVAARLAEQSGGAP